jgi:hypothetical protein
MPKTKPPVFHVPVGWYHLGDEPVIFANEADHDAAMGTWRPSVMSDCQGGTA